MSSSRARPPHQRWPDLASWTTCVIARLVARAYFLSSSNASCVAPATMRWALFVESCASLSCAPAQLVISPTVAVRTASGLPSRVRRAFAWLKTVGSCRNSIRLAVSWRGEELNARAALRARGGSEPNPLRSAILPMRVRAADGKSAEARFHIE